MDTNGVYVSVRICQLGGQGKGSALQGFQTRRWGAGNKGHGATHNIVPMDRMIGR